MPAPALIWMIANGVLFALWAMQMFRCLFRLRAEAAAAERRRTGRMLPGLTVTLRSFAAFLRHPHHRADRRRLMWLTLCLFAMLALRPLFWPLPVAP